MRQDIILAISLLVACGTSEGSTGAPPSRAALESDSAQIQADATHAAPAALERSRQEVNPRLLRRFKPLRAEIDVIPGAPASEALTDLGRMLFFDKRLSKSRDLSCNSCHDLKRYGVDGEPTSVGAGGKRGRRNSPTVYNAAGHIRSFWDGRAANVEEQANGPILSQTEMGMPSDAAVVAVLRGVPGYVTAFGAAFPGDAEPLTSDHVGVAIGAFERKLTTPSRWDRYLRGDRAALSSREIAGFQLFTNLGCMTCHTGEFVGGSSFQKVGVFEVWPNQADKGRFEVTRDPSDEMIFKVPSLRNIAKTAPYFHDGSARTLEDAVTMMARYQIGETVTADDVASIVAWLASLTGELPDAYIRAPMLPPDGLVAR